VRRGHRGAGFTLVEICVCLSILALLFTLSSSALSSFLEMYYLNMYRRQIVSDLREAKHAAVKGGNYVACQFYKKDGSTSAYYTISSILPDTKEKLLSQATLNPWLDFVEDQEIRFSNSSFCLPGYLGSIYIQGRSGRLVGVVVSSMGRVR